MLTFFFVRSFAVRLFSQYPSPLEWLNTLTEKDLQSPSEVTLYPEMIYLIKE
jgi:hypothetical protein